MFKLTIKDAQKAGNKCVSRKVFKDRNAAIAYFEDRYSGIMLPNGLYRYTYTLREIK